MWKEFVISESSFAQQKKQYETYSLLIKNKNLTPPSEAQIKEAVESFPSLKGSSLDNILDLQDDTLTKIVQEYDGDVKNLTKELSFVFYSIITGSSLEDILKNLQDSDIEKIEEGLFKSLAGILSSASKQQSRIDSKSAGSSESTKQLKYLDRVKQNAAMAVSLLTVKKYSEKINQIIKKPTTTDPSKRESELINSKKRYAQFLTSILQRVEADRRQEAIINAFVKLLTQGADTTVANYYNNDQQIDLLKKTINQLIDKLKISSDKKENIRNKNDDIEEDLLNYLTGN
jgi:Tfp pilus tip-associated adhesin PilY1